MAGGFAHLTAAGLAAGRLAEVEGLTPNDKRLLTQFPMFMDVGAVGPDYPYLGGQGEWADHMHYEKTADPIREGIRILRQTEPGAAHNKMLAWLLGYAAHVATDLTIHPIVERRVGPYAQNKTAHRTCEMNQDAYIWQRRNIGEIGLADFFRLIIEPCSTQGGDLDPDVARLWNAMLERVYPDFFAEQAPALSDWNTGFRRIVDIVDDAGGLLMPFTRHMLASQGVVYPKSDEVDRSFIDDLETPEGKKGYDEVFDRAVDSIVRVWSILGRALRAPSDGVCEDNLSQVPAGNLDTGRYLEAHERFVFWGGA